MPRLWAETIALHRHEVSEAILDATAALVEDHGLRAVTMSQIADSAGIARATLYKYFPDVEAILLAWHERQVAEHLTQLEDARDAASDARARVQAVLETFALMVHDARSRADRDLAPLLHGHEHVAHAQKRVRDLLRDVLAEAAAEGALRGDVPAGELATYCLHALGAGRGLTSRAAVRRLVAVTFDGLRAPAATADGRGRA